MITLTLEENQVLNNEQIISDLPLFLKSLLKAQDILVILKSNDALYHHCPIKKAARYMKSAEFSPNHWVGEKVINSRKFFARLYARQRIIGGVMPSPFMRQVIQLISSHSFALKGVFVWADLITQAYSPLPTGWAIICHDQHLMICYEQMLRFSRPCYLPFAQELPSILRYIKRFGYETGMPVTVIATSAIPDLPTFVNVETCIPHALKPHGLKLEIPELKMLSRLYSWPRRVKAVAYTLILINVLGTAYYGLQVKTTFEHNLNLKNEIGRVSIKNPLNEAKMGAFEQYCRLAKDQPHPLILLRRLIPLMKDDAVATYLHWTPNSLILHLELNPKAAVEQLWHTLRLQFADHHLTWQPDQNEPLKGALIIEKKHPEKTNL